MIGFVIVALLAGLYFGAGVGYFLGVMRDPTEVRLSWRVWSPLVRAVNLLTTVCWWPAYCFNDHPLWWPAPPGGSDE